MTIHSILATFATQLASNFRGTVSPLGDDALVIEGKTVNKGEPLRLKVQQSSIVDSDINFVVSSAPASVAHREAMQMSPKDVKFSLKIDEARSRISKKADQAWKRLEAVAVADSAAAVAFDADREGFAARTAATAAALVGVVVSQNAAGATVAKLVRPDGQTLDLKVLNESVLVAGLRLTVTEANALIAAVA